MSRIFEILGRAVASEVPALLCQWIKDSISYQSFADSAQFKKIYEIAQMPVDKSEDQLLQLHQYISEFPACIYGRMAVAAYLLDNGQAANAIEQLNSVYMRQPANTYALYAIGHCYELLGNDAHAIEFYQDCLKFKKHQILPAQRLAAIYFKNSQIERAIEQYILLKKESPEDMQTVMLLGQMYTLTGNYDKAIAEFNYAILAQPAGTQHDDQLLQSYILDQDYTKALERLDEIQEYLPQNTETLNTRADILNILGDKPEAIECLEQALEISPYCLQTAIKLASAYLNYGDIDRAVLQLAKSIDINDRYVDIYIELARAQNLKGKNNLSLNSLSMAAALQPNSGCLLLEIALQQFRLKYQMDKDYLNPIEDSQIIINATLKANLEQIDQNQQNPDLHYRLGVILTGLNQFGEAAESFQKALNINNAFSRAQNSLITTLMAANCDEKAMAELNSAEQMDSRTLKLHYETALLFCDKIKFASSLINLEMNFNQNLADIDTCPNISIVLRNLGLSDTAEILAENLAETATIAAQTDFF